MTSADSLAALATGHLLTASVQGGVVIVCVWVVTRRCAGLRPSLQAWLWWLASLKLLVLLAGVPGLPVPVLPPAAPSITRAEDDTRPAHVPWNRATAGASAPVAAAVDSAPPGLVAPGARASTHVWILAADLRTVLIALWGAGVATAFWHLFLSFRRMRRCAARSHAIGPEGRQLAGAIAARLGLRRVPDVRISHEVHAPQVAGVWRPVILIPAVAAAQWTREDLRMALCHELAHVRRRDLLYGWIPVLASRLFFFHPLAHLAAREYLLAREAACDAIVLQTLEADAAPYGRLLLRLGAVKPQSALVAGGSSATVSGLKRRLEMLNRTSFTVPAAHRWLIAVVATLALLPLDLVSRAQASPETRSPAPAAVSDRQMPAAQSSSTITAGRSQDLPAPTAARAAARSEVRAVERARETSPAPAVRIPESGGGTSDRTIEPSVVPEARRALRAAAQEQAAGAPQEPQPRELEVERGLQTVRDQLRAAEKVLALRGELERLRTRLREAELAATIERQSSGERSRRAAVTLEFLKNQVVAAEAELAAQARAAGGMDARAAEPARPLEEQMRTLDAQLEALTRQQTALARQQEALVAAQREIAMQLQRVREVLEQLRRSGETPEP